MNKDIVKYSVKMITENSDHDAVKYLDDEELLIVEDDNGNWWKATDFFYTKSITEFFVREELG